jgi:hypothetical protein
LPRRHAADRFETRARPARRRDLTSSRFRDFGADAYMS